MDQTFFVYRSLMDPQKKKTNQSKTEWKKKKLSKIWDEWHSRAFAITLAQVNRMNDFILKTSILCQLIWVFSFKIYCIDDSK